MKIFFDHQAFSNQEFGGISRYYTELINGINNTTDNNAYLSLLFSNNIHLKEASIKTKNFFSNINLHKKTLLMYRINNVYTKLNLRKTEYDIFHATYYDSYFLPYLKQKPFVITFLDMIHEKLSMQFEELAQNKTIIHQKKLIAERADKIIAISESTKQDIIDLLNIDPNKIDVVYLANSLKNKETNNYTLNTSPYLLFVGSRRHYKNFQGMLRSLCRLLNKYKLKIICAGGGDFSKEEKQLIHSFGINRWVEYIPVNDQILPKLYEQAQAFIFPSLYEGFGIPVLEAFACNCPCILSNVSSLPEIAGDAALYFDPVQPDSIAFSVERILLDTSLRNDLIQKGKKQLSKFSWRATVENTIKLYENII